MILVIDLTNDRLVFGAVDGRGGRWLEYPLLRGGQGALDKALRAFGSRRRPPTAVVLVERGGPDRKMEPHVSWSTVRAGVAMANTLAYSWNVPVVGLPPDGLSSRQTLAAAAWKAAKPAKTGNWVSAAYSGEPNITKSKKTL